MDRKDLKNYRSNQEWIQSQMEYIEEQKERVNKLTATLSDMPTGSREVQDGMAEKLARLMDCFNNLLENIVKEQQEQKRILEKLNEVEQPYRLLLYKMYVEGKSLVKVADEMNYSYEWTRHIHGIALNKFDEDNTKKHCKTL